MPEKLDVNAGARVAALAEKVADAEAARAQLAEDRAAVVLHTKTGAIAQSLTGAAREARIFCGYDGTKWLGKVAAGADRCGHVCPSCGRPTGLEV